MDKAQFTALRLQQYRSYSDFAVELSPSVNIIVGPNASGKTNLLEALLIVCGLSPYRATFADVISNDADWARIDGNLARGSRVVKITQKGELTERIYELNQKSKKRLQFGDTIPVILFEPEHMRLLTGSPELRREFFDQILLKTLTDFGQLKSRYKRTLAQRNRLLKSSQHSIHSQIFAWDIRLSELAGKIVDARLKLLGDLNGRINDTYSSVAQSKTDIKISYVSDINLKTYESSLLKKLENSLEKDILRGFTAYGPHREDVIILINGQPASSNASRGETRTLVLSLKLLELKLLQDKRAVKPLILLDDVFSELDGLRRKAITKYLQDYQTIITTTDADVVLKGFAQNTNLISLG